MSIGVRGARGRDGGESTQHAAEAVEVAVDLCDAHTVGISLLEGDVFRWEAAGVSQRRAVHGPLRDQSPCGVCIERTRRNRCISRIDAFRALLVTPRFVEVLLIPFCQWEAEAVASATPTTESRSRG